MKIYVDDLPKTCAECEHCTKAHEGTFGIPFCNVACMPIYGGNYDKGRGRHDDTLNDFDCPLHSLAEHDAKKDKRIAELEEQLSLELSNQELEKHAPAYCTLAGMDCQYLGQVKELQIKNIQLERALELATADSYYAQQEYYLNTPPSREIYIEKQCDYFKAKAKEELNGKV